MHLSDQKAFIMDPDSSEENVLVDRGFVLLDPKTFLPIFSSALATETKRLATPELSAVAKDHLSKIKSLLQ